MISYSEWFEHKIESSNDLENGFIETREMEFDKFCREEYKKELENE